MGPRRGENEAQHLDASVTGRVVRSARAARRRQAATLLAVLLVGPSLLLPLQLWHHHHDGKNDQCPLCMTAGKLAAVPEQPTVVEYNLPSAEWLTQSLPAPALPARPAPGQPRAPPIC